MAPELRCNPTSSGHEKRYIGPSFGTARSTAHGQASLTLALVSSPRTAPRGLKESGQRIKAHVLYIESGARDKERHQIGGDQEVLPTMVSVTGKSVDTLSFALLHPQ